MVITGAGGGIGRATAMLFAQHGARVVCVDIDGDTAAATASDCRSKGATADSRPCDVSDAAAVVALSRCLRADWSACGVGVSVICPGVINTPIPTRVRLVGPLAGSRDRAVQAFRRGHSPDLVARAILGGVRRNGRLVPVGVESTVAYRLHPLVPASLRELLARAGSRR
ncbi:SDR family NAD(P)-dependent oxidoreductase [Actinomadura napierensis]|uniref:SDR family NAD(P)-dependent oxidoreductase n=1 Tax=Actinomadura napierensis TaxID=267854 RepID=UPI0031D8B46C